jgi:hypothetical protein
MEPSCAATHGQAPHCSPAIIGFFVCPILGPNTAARTDRLGGFLSTMSRATTCSELLFLRQNYLFRVGALIAACNSNCFYDILIYH